MFLYVGMPGLLIALLILTIREPVRRELLRTGVATQAAPLWDTLAFLFKRWRTYIVLFLALSVLAIMAYGVGFWIPEFLRRSYVMDDKTWGTYVAWRGVITVVGGLIGVLAGGWAVDGLKDKYPDSHIRICLAAFVMMAIGYCTFALMPTPELALLMLVPASIGATAPTAAGAAAVITISPPQMRSQIVAFYYFILNVVGLTVGPLAVAAMTDFYFEAESQLRYSITVVATFFSIVGILLLIYNRRHFIAGMEEAKSWS
jgi:MFS family permease